MRQVSPISQEQTSVKPDNENPVDPHRQPSASDSMTPSCRSDYCASLSNALAVLAFYFFNVLTDTFQGWISVLAVSGTENKEMKWMVIFLGAELVIGCPIMLISFMNQINSKFNYWTAAVLAESSKERRASKFITSLQLLMFFGISTWDWYDCWRSGSIDGVCEGSLSFWPFVGAAVLNVLALWKVWSHNGPFSEQLELTHPVFYKLKLKKGCVPTVWENSARIMESLRTMTSIIESEGKSVAELKKISYLDDLEWDWIEDMTDDDIKEMTLAVRGVKARTIEKEYVDFLKAQIDLYLTEPNAELSFTQQVRIISNVVDKFLQSKMSKKLELICLVEGNMKREKFEKRMLELWHTTRIPHVIFGIVDVYRSIDLIVWACCSRRRKKTSDPQMNESPGGETKHNDVETGNAQVKN